MLSFVILLSALTTFVLYAIMYIAECIFIGFRELFKLGGEAIDRGITKTGQCNKEQNKGCRKAARAA